MYKIKLFNNISEIGLRNFPKDDFVYSSDAEEYDGILVRSANLSLDSLPESVLAISRAGAGVNNIPVEGCTELGIPVFNTPGANANAVKEMVVAALYMSSRNVAEAIAWVDTIKDRGDEIPKLVEDGKAQFVGPEVSGKSLGVIGLGAVGVLVANVATNLGLTVYGYDPYISVDRAWGLSRAVIHANDINDIYANCDYITIHIPLTKETHSFINAENIKHMKPGVRVLNFARGELINSEDMVEAVKSGKVFCYVTDFPDKYLIGQKGILSVPHLGASTPESEENCAVMAVNELVSYLQTGSITNAVNFPVCEAPSTYIGRITMFNKNEPGVLSLVTTLASESGYNIDHMTSSSNKGSGTAYMILDLDKKPEQAFIEQLKELPGIIRVRVIG
ncbi:MAG: NAD(P)-binding domain-containing protein [Oscillospiraceae bacterium]|nr:NAD(P)-binding domain-containing protein [Oscillospiraceae bacterium]